MELYTFSMNIFMVLCKKLHKNRIIGLKYCINIQNRVYIYTKSVSKIMLWQLLEPSVKRPTVVTVNFLYPLVLIIKFNDMGRAFLEMVTIFRTGQLTKRILLRTHKAHIAPKDQRIIHNGNKRTQTTLAPYHQQPEQRNTCTAQHDHRIGPGDSCSPKANHPRQQKQIKAKKIPTEILAKPICPISNTFPMALHSLIHRFSLRLTTTHENTPPMTTDKNI